MFQHFGYAVTPRPEEARADIIQAVMLRKQEALVAFCQGIQKGAPVDSFVVPEPWDMPGYDCQVIMAAGAFTLGASIELSADAPLREPYAAWMQGGLNFHSGKLGAMLAAQSMLEQGILFVPPAGDFSYLDFPCRISYNKKYGYEQPYFHAGVVELADTPDLGSGGRPCRFKSCHPYQQKLQTLYQLGL